MNFSVPGSLSSSTSPFLLFSLFLSLSLFLFLACFCTPCTLYYYLAWSLLYVKLDIAKNNKGKIYQWSMLHKEAFNFLLSTF